MSELRDRHVVVVDDTASFRRFVSRALKAEGLQVTEAGDFASAIDIFEGDEQVDLMIADLALGPDSPHGVSLCNMAQLRRGRLKVILMSGSFDVKHAAQFANSPAAVLQKPFTARELIDAVTTALGRASSAT